MRHLKTSVPAAVLTLLVTAGCERSDGPFMAPGPDDAALNASAAHRPQHSWTSDAEFARAARAEAPGFAGYYLENDGTPVVLLTDPRQRGAAERYLVRELAGNRSGRHTAATQRPAFRTVAHDFAELKDWFDVLESLVELREDVYLLDVDEVNNRLHAGVRDQVAIQAVREHAARAGIPPAAVHAEIQPAPEQRISVRDRTPTLAGGYQIAFNASYVCTLGFNAVYQGYWSGVTNSHCTTTYFGSDGGTIMQNTWASGNAIGYEVRDRGLYACWGSGTSCRRADAAYIRYNGSRSVSQGGIARTAWATGGPGGLTVLGEYDVVRRYAGSTPVGTWLDKTGRTTGTTYGQVTNSCVTIGNLRCQDISKVYSAGGDSGSPMYVWIGNNQVELQGILWGGPGSDYTTTYSSRLAGIEYDLGGLSGLCRPGWGC
jgi:hypothetical protein